MVSCARVSTVVDNLQVPSLVVVAVPALHVAVVVSLLVPELPVVPVTSSQVSILVRSEVSPYNSPNASVVTKPVAVGSPLAMDLELNLLGFSILLSTVPSRFPHYRSLEVVTMEVATMEALVIVWVVTLALQIVIDTPGCELGLPGLQIMLLGRGQPCR